MIVLSWLAAALAHVNEGVVIAEYGEGGLNNPIVYANPKFLDMTGYDDTELMGQDCCFLGSVPAEQHVIQSLKQDLCDGRECSTKLRQHTKNGEVFWNYIKIAYIRDKTSITHIVSINRDITQEEHTKNALERVSVLYRAMSRRLEHANETDLLTQLKNRGHLSTRGEFILGTAKRERLRLHTVLIDVDHFKLFNAIGGRELGDYCLQRVANIVSRYFSRATDLAIRMRNDEFVVICIEDDDNRIVERAEALREDVRNTQIAGADNHRHEISVSIGIYSITPEKHTTIDDMIERAAQLLLQAAPNLSNHVAHTKGNDGREPRPH
jgi:diguanylate cyclase (GGDEF)-like protein/PAS domain S-box-containing protein